MDELESIIAYLCAKYPHKDELSKSRLTKMVYLADWVAAMNYGKQLTGIDWVFNHFGPYVADVIQAISRSPDFEVVDTVNAFGSEKSLIVFRGSKNVPVSSSTEKVLDFVIEKTAPLSWQSFIRLVYSTYPVLTQPRYAVLDLPKLAKDYERYRQQIQQGVS
jgi:hypothetical protein